MKRIYILTALLLSLLTLFGCSALPLLPTETIKAPRTTGEFEEIRNALEAAVGKNIVLKYPKCGSSSASYIAGDIDGDGESEILAFYQYSDNTSATHINILKMEDGKWISKGDIAPVGSNLERMAIADLDNDGCAEIISGWSVYDSKNYELAVFSASEGSVVQRTSEKYTDFIISDFDGDKVKEIVIVLLSPLEKKSDIFFYGLNADGMVLKGKSSLDGTVASYSGITEQKSSFGTCYYIDGKMGNGAMITELIEYKDGVLSNIFYDPDTFSTSYTYRPFEIAYKSDGSRILMPFVKYMAGITDDTQLKQYLIDWKYYNGDELINEYTSYYCAEGNYELKIPEEWQQTVICSYVSDKRTLIFYEYSSEDSPAVELFRITEVPAEESENYVLTKQNARLITMSEKTAYYAEVTQNNSLGITAENIVQYFAIRES